MKSNEAKLRAYLDNELSTAERERLEAYLGESPSAQAALDRLREQREMVNQGLELLRPTAQEQSPARLALRRLRSTIKLDQPIRDGAASEPESLTVWESPSLWSQLKSGCLRLWPTQRQPQPRRGRERGWGWLASFALLLLVVGATALLWPSLKQHVIQPEERITQPAEIPPTTDLSEPVAAQPGGRLLFEGKSGLYLIDADGANSTQLTTGEENWISGGTWSPAGQKIAYLGLYEDKSEIYVMNADGGNPRRLTHAGGSPFLPVWSPDGQYLAFISDLSDRNSKPNIYVIGADGANQIRLTDSSTSDVAPRWSPDGRQLAFASLRNDNYDIYLINRDGTGLVRVTDHPDAEWLPVWSPDGQRLAFFAGQLNDQERAVEQNIYTMDRDGKNRNRVINLTGGQLRPRLIWSPDGKKLAFAYEVDDRADLYTIDADGANINQVTATVDAGFNFDWSPDGRQLAFTTAPQHGDAEVYVVDVDGSNLQRVATAGGLGYVEWAPPTVQPVAGVTQVVVALQPIEQGQPFSAGSIGRRNRPAQNLPPGVIVDERQTLGQVAAMDIVQGQVIVRDMLTATTNLPLEKLVLQPEDLPEGTQWQKSGPIILDDPANPLLNSSAFQKEDILENYRIFAFVPLWQPGNDQEAATPIINHIYRYESPAKAHQQWLNLVKSLLNDRLQEIIPLANLETRRNTYRANRQTFVARLKGDEGETVYWGLIIREDILELLVVDDPSTIFGQASPTPREFFIHAIKKLEQRLEGQFPAKSNQTQQPTQSDLPGKNFVLQPDTPLTFSPRPGMLIFASHDLGFTVLYPQAWQNRWGEQFVIFSPTAQGLDPETPTGATIWLGRIDQESASLELLEKHLTGDPGRVETLAEGLLYSGDYPWASVQSRIESEALGGQIMATLAVTVRNGQSYFWLALAPAGEWNQIQPIFQNMMESFEFSEPLEPAARQLSQAVTNYETCVAVSNLVLTSNPSKCIAPNGQIFVKAPLTAEVLIETLRELAEGK